VAARSPKALNLWHMKFYGIFECDKSGTLLKIKAIRGMKIKKSESIQKALDTPMVLEIEAFESRHDTDPKRFLSA
jgi:hypothetical protein